jgi:hypothetical protein
MSLEEKRAQGRPGAGRTRSLVCSVGSTRVIHHRLDRNIRPSLRDGVNAYFRALPGVRDLIVTVACRLVTRRLSASPGAPGPHDFVVRVHAARRATQIASIASRPTFVTTRSPLLPGWDSVTIIIILKNGSKIFFARGLDRDSQKSLVGQITCAKMLFCKAFCRGKRLSRPAPDGKFGKPANLKRARPLHPKDQGSGMPVMSGSSSLLAIAP